MTKLIVKVTVDGSTDPELYESVALLPRRRRSTAIRRLWGKGLWLESLGALPPGQPMEGSVRASGHLPPTWQACPAEPRVREPVGGDSLDVTQLAGLFSFG